MSKKRNKITIFIVAALMFTSTWAGAFAADPEQQGDGDQSQTPAVTNTEGQDNTDVTNDGGTPAEAGNTQGGDVNTKVDGDEEETVPTIKAPTATVSGNTITVTWDAVEGASGYTITEKVNGKEDSDPVYDGEETTCTLENKEVGKYAYKVAIKESTDESNYSSEVIVRPEKVTDVRALSGKQCVVIKWKDKNDADGYIIYRYTSASDFNNNKWEKRIDPNGTSYLSGPTSSGEWTWTNAANVSLTKNYWYKVVAVKKMGDDFKAENVIESYAVWIQNKGCVRPMYITLKLKKKRTLKSFDGGPKITLKKNTSITAYGFGGGCYYFTYKNGKNYRMARTSAKKQVAHYNGRYGYNYTREEAELFINQAKLTSKTNYLIWVSFYTQRVYIMQKTSAGWKCINDWDCATGKASTPSPTGHKMVGKKKSSHHNIKWWSSFSNMKSIANSLHGKKKGWKLGLPQSHGCIRNDVANAKWIYDHCPKYTKVYNY